MHFACQMKARAHANVCGGKVMFLLKWRKVVIRWQVASGYDTPDQVLKRKCPIKNPLRVWSCPYVSIVHLFHAYAVCTLLWQKMWSVVVCWHDPNQFSWGRKIGYTTHRHGDRNIRYNVLNRSRIYIESSKRFLDTNTNNHTIHGYKLLNIPSNAYRFINGYKTPYSKN
jgi:hypothetical protein